MGVYIALKKGAILKNFFLPVEIKSNFILK
jgi:hypothetical protein